jgi:hypothetical protein
MICGMPAAARLRCRGIEFGLVQIILDKYSFQLTHVSLLHHVIVFQRISLDQTIKTEMKMKA